MFAGEKIRLRPMTDSDVDTVRLWENDPALWELSGTTSPYSREAIQELTGTSTPVNFYENGQLRFIIELTETGEIIGVADLFDYDPVNREAAVGILIYEPEFRRKGYGSEALRLTEVYAFSELAIRRLYAHIFPENEASVALFTSAGYKKEGKIKNGNREIIVMVIRMYGG